MESIRLDLVPDGAMPELHASQYDKGRKFRLNLLDFGIDYTLDGTETLTIEERKVDGNICVRVVANTFSGKKYVEFTTTEQMCACAGYNLCELHIVKGEDSIGTLNFILNVERSPIEGGLSGSEIENLYTQIDARVDVDVADIMDDYYKKSETYSSEEIDNALDLKANASDVYDKTEIDTALASKANTSDVNTALALKADKATTYDKTEVDTLVAPKADKSYVDSELATKANSADVYNKTAVDNALALKADKTDVDALKNIVVPLLFAQTDFEVGAISGSSGNNSSNSYRIRLINKFLAPFRFSITNTTGYNFTVFRYTKAGVYIDNTGYLNNDTIHTVTVNADENIRIVIYKIPLTEVTTAIYNNVIYSGYSKFDEYDNEIEKIEKYDDYKVNEVLSNAKFFENADITYLSNKYYVGKSGDYQTINAALTAWANDNYPPAVVFIENGEYNETVYVEDKTIAFIGESKDGTIVRTKNGDYSHPPFKIHHGNVLIANLTAIADHSSNPSFVYTSGATMAYAFHVDGGNVGGNVVIRNCKGVSYQSPAFGMGLIPYSNIRLENVEAFSYTDDTTNSGQSLDCGCVFCHMAAPSLYPDEGEQSIQLVNVKAYSKNTERVIRLTQNASTETLAIEIINTITSSSKSGATQDNMVLLPTKFELSGLCSGNSCPKVNV